MDPLPAACYGKARKAALSAVGERIFDEGDAVAPPFRAVSGEGYCPAVPLQQNNAFAGPVLRGRPFEGRDSV